jgi:hypothetical protein
VEFPVCLYTEMLFQFFDYPGAGGHHHRNAVGFLVVEGDLNTLF